MGGDSGFYSIFRELLSRMITRYLSYQRDNISLICTSANKRNIVPEDEYFYLIFFEDLVDFEPSY